MPYIIPNLDRIVMWELIRIDNVFDNWCYRQYLSGGVLDRIFDNRGDRIWTYGLLVPNQALCQAELHPGSLHTPKCTRLYAKLQENRNLSNIQQGLRPSPIVLYSNSLTIVFQAKYRTRIAPAASCNLALCHLPCSNSRQMYLFVKKFGNRQKQGYPTPMPGR